MGLTRKRITVRGKKKTYQRTVMVKAEQAQGARAPAGHGANKAPTTEQHMLGKLTGLFSRKQNARALKAMNPWEPRHTWGVRTDRSLLGDTQMYYGTSGPGSDHSLLAHAVGTVREREAAVFQRGHNRATDQISGTEERYSGSTAHAGHRRFAAEAAGNYARPTTSFLTPPTTSRGSPRLYPGDIPIGRSPINVMTRQIAAAFGGAQVSHVAQNHKKWVR